MTALFASVPLVLAADAGVDGWRYALLGFMTVLGASQLASALANWLVGPADDSAPAAQDGFLAWASGVIPQPRRDTDAADLRRPDRRAARIARGPVSRQSRRPPAFRPADGLLRCGAGIAERGRAASAACAQRNRAAEREVRIARGRSILPAPSPAPLESRRNSVWMGYERKRGKLADLNALLRGRGRDRFSLIVGDVAALSGRRVRHHARHRHAAAARIGAAVRRDDGAPAQSPALRRSQGPRHRRLRHPAAAHGREPVRHAAFALRAALRRASPASTRTRAPSRTSTRTCSARARSSARASTTSMPSSARSTAAFPRIASSATTCSKAATRARAC